jgi:hypothetical protein
MTNKKLLNRLCLGFLSLVLLILFITNFNPNTYLAGWDNLMPELNIWMNLKRSLFAAWQEYQGLGLVGGMGHATDLIRQIILLPFILVLPNNWIRYLWTFGMIGLGTFGVYFGLKKSKKFDSLQSVLGGLFYLLNFGTIQIFWPPFEAFTTFWGFFPWLIFLFIKLLKKPNKKNWLWFVIINILAIPSFYIPTLFVVYGLCLGIIWLFSLRNTIRGAVKRHLAGITPFIVVLAINTFWVLPFIYFLITNAHHPRLAIGNVLSSEQTVMRNQYRGVINDFLLLRGYYFDFHDAGKPLMADWINHFNQPWVLIIGYFLGGLSLIGLLSAPGWLIGIFCLSAVALLSATVPFSWLNEILRSNSFLNQVFRSPFTKFIAPASFSFSMLLAYSLKTINKIISKINLNKSVTKIYLPLILSILILIYSYPVFQGKFIYPKMRTKIPNEYQQLIDYFKTQPATARIANLPQGDFWGWTHYRWGLRGSGFIWYGIEQPIMDRAFDVWNLKNEQYYWDLNYALQRNDLTLMEAVLDKYFVDYVVFDDNVFFPGQKIYAKQALKTEEMLTRSKELELVREFDEIKVYKHDLNTQPVLSTSQNTVKLPDLTDYHKKETEPIANSINFEPDYKRCNTSMRGQRNLEEKQNQNGETFYQLTATHDDACLGWWFPSLPLTDGYLLEIEYRTHQGYPPLVAAFDGHERYKFFFKKLDETDGWHTAQAVIPPMKDQWQTGIGFTFSNISYNQFPSKNDIKNIKIYPLEFDQLNAQYRGETKPLEFSSNIWKYNIKVNSKQLSANSENQYLVLPQSFDQGWTAFYFNGINPVFLNNHTLINNWANGWKLNSNVNNKIYIIFWPQLLEFLGLTSLFGVTIYLWRKKLD